MYDLIPQVMWVTEPMPYTGVGASFSLHSVSALNDAARTMAYQENIRVVDFAKMMRGCSRHSINTGSPCDGYLQMQETLW